MKFKKSYRLNLLTPICVIAAFAGFIFQLIDDTKIHFAGFIVGGLLGLGFWIIEFFIFPKLKIKLLKLPILYSIFINAILNLIIIILFSGIMGFIAGYIEGKELEEFYTSRYDKEQLVLNFYTLILYIFLSLYVQLDHFFGRDMLLKYFLGKYRKPFKENRIFMFLDLKSSTTLAEKLGLEDYYSLLDDFFHEITEPVYDTNAEIYQYVGDEVVFTWKTDDGIQNLNCIELFYRIKEKVEKNSKYYFDKYAVIPQFKAGIHVGEVISAQIGDVKRELVYNGDVLNTSARIQGQCNKFNKELIISGELLKLLNLGNKYKSEKLAAVKLRGKEISVELIGIKEAQL